MPKLKASAELGQSSGPEGSPLKVVLGIRLRQKPRIYDRESEFYIPGIEAVMVSYAHVLRSRARRAIEERGLHSYLGFDGQVYLDNGAFSAARNGVQLDAGQYVSFVDKAGPDWFPIPRDYIPLPVAPPSQQRLCFLRTTRFNNQFAPFGFVPVIHGGDYLPKYIRWLESEKIPTYRLALGALVPRLLNSKGLRLKRRELLGMVATVRRKFSGNLHVFGVGGVTTIHLMAALGIDSIDTIGWRVRAAWGVIQLPGNCERGIVERGPWQRTPLNAKELRLLKSCPCPACQRYGIGGLRGDGMRGFECRATHNAWTLLREANLIRRRMEHGDYREWMEEHVSSPLFRDLIGHALDLRAAASD